VVTSMRRSGGCGRLSPGARVAQQSNECDPDNQA
jgi:hypothetical protein